MKYKIKNKKTIRKDETFTLTTPKGDMDILVMIDAYGGFVWDLDTDSITYHVSKDVYDSFTNDEIDELDHYINTLYA